MNTIFLLKQQYFIIFFIIILLFHQTVNFCKDTSFKEDGTAITSIDASINNNFLLIATQKQVVLRNMSTLQILHRYQRVGFTPVSVKISKDNSKVVIGYKEDSSIHIFPTASPYTPVTSFSTGLNQQLISIDVNEGSTKIIVCGDDKFAWIYQFSGALILKNDMGNGNAISYACAFGRTDDKTAFSDKNNNDLFVFDPFGTQLDNQNIPDGYMCVDFNDVDDKIILSCRNHKAQMYTFNDSREHDIIDTGQILYACSYSRDSKFFAFGGDSSQLFVYNGTSYLDPIYTFTELPTASIRAIKISSDNLRIFSGNTDGNINIYKQFNCTQCRGGQYFNSSNNFCQPCIEAIPGCLQCSSRTNCHSCVLGYYKVSAISCQKCSTITGCLVCNSSSICTLCTAGYFHDGATNTCKACLTNLNNCLVCINQYNCTSCQQNYMIKSVYNMLRLQNQDICVSCSGQINNCLKCVNGSYCYECVQGYYATNLGACSTCPSSCLSCLNTTNCQQCQMGYKKSGGSCISCGINACLACTQSGLCIDCRYGYYPSGGICFLCLPPCATCNSSQCFSCIQQFYYDSSAASKCSRCPTNCTSCNSSFYCMTCALGFYLKTDNTCHSCVEIDDNCVQCTSTICLNCGFGYYNSSNMCSQCSLQITGCMDCNTSTYCYHCLPGLYVKSDHSSCLSCPEGCSMCLSSTDCVSCLPGFYLDSPNKKCLVCSNNCVTCTSSTYCLYCQQGFYTKNTTGVLSCVQCNSTITNCLSCLSSSYCIECQIHHYINPVNNGSCLFCVLPCVTCSSSINCLSCQLGYYLNGGSCLTCGSNCSQCTNSTICVQCDIGFYWDTSNTKCQSCTVLGCEVCNNTKCFSCSEGWFINSSDLCQSCSNSIDSCLICISSSVCIECQYGYLILANNTCGPCSEFIPGCFHCVSNSQCEVCQLGFYLRLADKSCQPCMMGCDKCLNGISCISCQFQYTAVLGVCQLCQDHILGCKFCESTTDCTVCAYGYYLYSSSGSNLCQECKTPLQGCLYCNSSSICTHCQDGYYLHSSNKCIKCSTISQGCQLCNSSSICLQCEIHFYLDTGNNKCKACNVQIPGCINCLNVNTCLNCQNAYFKTASHLCNTCSSQMEACIYCSSETQCLQCEGGFYLDTGTQKCLRCQIENCQTCNQTDPTKCTTCNTDYYYFSGICIGCDTGIPGCLECSDGTTCFHCDVGYYIQLSNNTCLLCSQNMIGCTRCQSGTLCLQCKSKYFLNVSSNLCEQCRNYLEGCDYCIQQTICYNCGYAYYLNSTTQQCQLCSVVQGCLSCHNQTNCLHCLNGYYLNSTSTLCQKCNATLQGCFTCNDNATCTSCAGGYSLTDEYICRKLLLQSDWEIPQLKMKSTFKDKNTLIHYLFVSNQKSYKKKDFTLDQWKKGIKMFITDLFLHNATLKILEVKYGQNLKNLIVTTDNPLNLTASQMPMTRLLLEGSVTPPSWNINLQISQGMMKQILPDLAKNKTIQLGYVLSQAEFYTSFTLSIDFYFYYLFGLIITFFLFILYFIKSLVLKPLNYDKGQIIPHIFAIKCGSLVLFPTYSQYINYCWGFMSADIPWAHQPIGNWLGDHIDKNPDSFKIYFVNLNFGSLYFLASIFIILLLSVSYFIGHFSNKMQGFYSFRAFLYNFFCLGFIFASCASLQGTILNGFQQLNINTVFYTFGIMVYVIILIQSFYSLWCDRKYVFKQRVILKTTLLSVMHLSPIYIGVVMVALELLFIATQFIINRTQQSPKPQQIIKIISNILINAAFIILVYVPGIKIGIILTSVLVCVVLVLQMYLYFIDFCNCNSKVSDENFNTKSSFSNTKMTLKQKYTWDLDDNSNSSNKIKGDDSIAKLGDDLTPYQPVLKNQKKNRNKSRPEVIKIQDLRMPSNSKRKQENEDDEIFVPGSFLK